MINRRASAMINDQSKGTHGTGNTTTCIVLLWMEERGTSLFFENLASQLWLNDVYCPIQSLARICAPIKNWEDGIVFIFTSFISLLFVLNFVCNYFSRTSITESITFFDSSTTSDSITFETIDAETTAGFYLFGPALDRSFKINRSAFQVFDKVASRSKQFSMHSVMHLIIISCLFTHNPTWLHSFYSRFFMSKCYTHARIWLALFENCALMLHRSCSSFDVQITSWNGWSSPISNVLVYTAIVLSIVLGTIGMYVRF